MTDEMGLFTPTGRSTAWWRRRSAIRKIGLLTAAVVVAASVVWGTTELLRSCGSPWSGVNKVDGECVGVTDGSYAFRTELEEVQNKIADENARVVSTSNYVTVALLDPLTPASANVLPDGEIRNRLEGAYTALRRVNTTPSAGNIQPQIRLLLASEGRTDAQREHVIGRLVEMSKQEENPLVAVIGLGVSTEQTRWRAEKLSEAKIPMVGAYLTADTLSYENFPGLIKTSPTNRHYVEALSDYVKNRREVGDDVLRSAMMVRDSNSGTNAKPFDDLFTWTLADNFKRQMGKGEDGKVGLDMIGFERSFRGRIDADADVDHQLFNSVTNSICAKEGLDTVLYAGREIDLDAFLDSLKLRYCKDNTPLTILTAGLDLGKILKGREQELIDARLTIVVAGTVDVEEWTDADEPKIAGAPAGFDDFLEAFKKDFEPENLEGANAIMVHDALLAAAQAVRLAAPDGSASSVTRKDVLNELWNLNDEASAIQGASGTLNFNTVGSSDPGNPVGKPVPVLQYPRPFDGSSRQVGPLYTVRN